MPQQQRRAAAEVAEKKAAEAIRVDDEGEDDMPETIQGFSAIPDEESESSNKQPIAGSAAKARLAKEQGKANQKPIAGAAAKARLSGATSAEGMPKATKMQNMEKEADETEQALTAEAQGTRKGAQEKVCHNISLLFLPCQCILYIYS